MKNLSTLLATFILVLGTIQIHAQENQYSFVELQLQTEKFYELSQEQLTRSKDEKFIIKLPTDIDCSESFFAQRSQIMSKEFAKLYPDIQTYTIRKEDEPSVSGRLMISAMGISYVLKTNQSGLVSLSPKEWGKASNYKIEKGLNLDNHTGHFCGADMSEFSEPVSNYKGPTEQNGSTKRRLRVAIVTTGQYAQANGGSVVATNNAIVSLMNSVELVYTTDINVGFTVLTPVVNTDPNSDGFSGDQTGGASRPVQASEQTTALFGANNFDIGHVLHRSTAGDGYSGGGVAYLGAVCRNQPIGNGGVIKGGGWSGWDNTNGNAFVYVVCHEMGHMFNSPHTWNGSGGSCGGGISPTGAYEIGSGTSIMSYRSLCAAEQNISNTFPSSIYFHANSIQRMHDYLKFTPECEGLPVEDNGNNPPVADANPCNAVYNMPRGVPFFLTGEGNDVDSDDQLTYQWEPYNEDGSGSPTQGLIGASAANSTRAPIFRSRPPSSTTQTRYFPLYTDWVEGVDYPFEQIPQVARTLSFRYVVRDNNIQDGAGIAWDEIDINVRNSGPLVIDYPAGGETLVAGEQVTFQWNPNGNEDVCDKADLLLSLDGGYSFPIVVANDVDYLSGSHALTLPEGLPNSENARLMVRCDDFSCFKFFNMSEGPFTIESSCFAAASSICNNAPETYNTQDPGLNMFLGGAIGAKVTSLTRQITNSSDEMMMAAQASSGNGCAGIKTTEYEFVEISCTTGGTYTFDLDVDNQGGQGFVTIYEKDGFNPSSPCASFVRSSAKSTGQGNVLSYNDSFSAPLVSCKQYILAFYNDGDYPVETIISNITGPGDILSSSGIDSQNFSFTYIAVDQFTGLIDLVSDNANFISLLPGQYNIHGAYYKSGGPTPPPNIDPNSWVGKAPEEIYAEGQCGVFSSNFKPITILSTCSIDPNITISSQSACDPNSNLYTQTLVVSYAMNPTVGQIVVNDQAFDITGSPQTITLTGLLSNSEPVDLELFFSEDPQCFQFLSEAFTATDNCCPFEINLNEFYAGCVGESIILDTEVSGADHIWFKNGNEMVGEIGQSITVDSDGLYTVEVRNATGCLRISDAEVSFSPLPEIDLGDDREVCGAGTRRVQANTDASTIQWFIDDVLQVDEVEFTIPIFLEGEYKAVVENSFGCISSDAVNLTVLPTPVINFPPSTFLCEGEKDTLDAGIGETYKWTYKGDTLTFAEQFLETFDEGGVYTVTVTNEFECINTGQTVVIINDNPTVTLSPTNPSICENGGFVILDSDPNGASDLQWFYEGNAIPNANDFAVTAFQSGTYQFLATSNLGCTVLDSIVVGEIPAPMFDLPLDQFICGSSIELGIDNIPGATYVWSIGGTILQSGTNPNYIATEEAIYTLEVTSSGGCSETDFTSVSFGEEVDIELGPDVIACDENLLLSNVSSTFNVQWFLDGEPDPNGSGNNYFSTTSGLVLAIAENTDGCTASDSMQYTNFKEPDYDYPEELTLCIGTDFSFNLDNPDGFDLRWYRDNVEFALNQNPLEITESGVYRIDFESGLGCDYSFETEIEFVIGPDLTINQDNFDGCDGDEFTIVAMTSGDIIEWQMDGVTITGETGNTLDVTMPGTYTVIAGGIGDCDIAQNAIVTIGETPIVDLGDDVSSCGDTTLILSGPSGNFSYQWFLDNNEINGATAIELSVDEPGIYTLEVSGGGSCTGTDEITLEIGMPPSVEITGGLGICDGQSTILTAQSSASQFQWFLNGVEIQDAISNEITINEAGEYSVTTNPGSSCSSEDVVEVIEGMGAPISIGGDQTACETDDILIEADVTSGTFEWFLNGQAINGEDGNSITVSEEGEYQLNLTDDSGCLSTATMSVTIISQPTVSLPMSYSYCVGGSVTLEANTNASPIAWYLDDVIIQDLTSQEITVTTPGVYTVEVGSGDCSAEASTTVTEDSNLTVDLGQDRMICLSDGFVLDAGGGAMEYIWTLEGNTLPFETPTITPTVTGTYIVTVIVTDDCEATDEIFIEVDDTPMLQILNTQVAFCIGETYTIETITDGSNFRWYEDGAIISGETSNTLDVNSSATYTFETWFDNEDCSTTEDIEVLAIDQPDVDLGPDQTECEGTEIILSAGNNGINYTWYRNNIPIAEDVNEYEVTESGTYRVEVSAGPNCEGSDEVEITFISIPDLDLPTSASFCTDDILFLEADGFASEYQWSLDGNELTGETDDNIIIDVPGTYTLVAFNDPSCPVTYEVEIIETDSPNIELGDDASFCTGESLLLDAGNIGQNYSWFFNGNPIGEDESTLEVTEAGTYSVNVSAGQDCEGDDEIEISVAEIPSIMLPDDLSLCDGQSMIIEADVIGGSTYLWYLDGQIIDDEIGTTIEIDQAGEYTFEAFDNPACGETAIINITLLDAPIVDLGEDVFECQGEDITVDAGNPNSTYQWFKDGQEISGATDQTYDITESGTYSVEVSAGLDCAGEDEIVVDFSGFPEIDLIDNAEFCTGSSLVVFADSDASSYQWFLDGNILNGETTETIEVNEAGEYLVQAYNNIDCPSEATINITESVIDQVDLGSDQSLCSGEATTLSSSVTGEDYEWYLDGMIIETGVDEIEVDQSGTYSLIVIISEDCESTDEVEIDISDAPELDLPSGESICDGESITIVADSDAENFQWYLDGNAINGETTASIDISTPGEYSVDAFNNPDCTTTEEITIGEGASPSVDLGTDTSLCPEGSLQLDAGDQELYTWSDGTNQQIIFITSDFPTIETTEIYSVTVTNSDNCSAIDEIEVTFLPAVNASIVADITNLCDGETAELSASGGDNYLWSNANTLNSEIGSTVTANPESSTTYTVTVTDNECPDNESTASITINIANTNIIATQDTCIFNGQEITLSVSGGITYVWEDDESITSSVSGSNISVNPNETTTYQVTIFDSNGCEHERFIEVCVNPSPAETIKFVTIMTPNGDGDNDILEFKGLEDFPLNNLRVFNRWGVQVYERPFYQNDGERFDGTRNGEELPPGIYYYILEFEGFEIKKTLTIVKE